VVIYYFLLLVEDFYCFWNSFKGSHFSTFIHEYIIYISTASYTLSLFPLPTCWYKSPRKDLFYLPVLCFLRKNTFLLIKITLQGVSLWHLHIYIYIYICIYIYPNWFTIFLLLPYIYSLKILHCHYNLTLVKLF
jgi:hypothetical protein